MSGTIFDVPIEWVVLLAFSTRGQTCYNATDSSAQQNIIYLKMQSFLLDNTIGSS